jgi:kynurenine formamidase
MARRIVDLTQPLNRIGSSGEFSVREYERPRSGHGVFHRVEMETTAGTHVVTSRRYLASGYSLSEAPTDKFFGEAEILRFPTTDNITEIGTSQLDDAAGDRVQRDDIVVLAPVINTSARLKLTVFATQWFWGKGIKMLVIDHRIGIGSSTSWNEERTVLTPLFANEIPVVRGATNTEALSGERFAVMALPMLIDGVEAWPVRVVALDPGEVPGTESPAAAKDPAAVATTETNPAQTVTAEPEDSEMPARSDSETTPPNPTAKSLATTEAGVNDENESPKFDAASVAKKPSPIDDDLSADASKSNEDEIGPAASDHEPPNSESATTAAAEPLESLDLSDRAMNCLKRHGLETIQEVAVMTEDDLFALRGIGLRLGGEIRNALTDRGHSLADPEAPVATS